MAACPCKGAIRCFRNGGAPSTAGRWFACWRCSASACCWGSPPRRRWPNATAWRPSTTCSGRRRSVAWARRDAVCLDDDAAAGAPPRRCWPSLLAFVALVLLPVFGTDFGKGAVRWYSLGFGSFQPSEFLKPAYVILAAWLMAAQPGGQRPAGQARWRSRSAWSSSPFWRCSPISARPA